MKEDDERLIDDTLAGDTAAFGELVAKYQDRLFNTLRHVLGCAEEAEDVAQEAFIQAFIKLSSFRRSSAFYTWLYRIAFNTAISRKRRKRVEYSVEQGREVMGDEPLDQGDAPSDRMERQERVNQVQSALSRLDEQHRTILVLREMDGCCYEDMADILDLPLGTVRSRLHRARVQLKNQLENVVQGN